MLFQQSNDMEFAWSVLLFCGSTSRHNSEKRLYPVFVYVCVCLPSILDLPMILIVSAGEIRTNKQSLVQKSSAYFFLCSLCLISDGCCAQQLALRDTVLYTSWRVPTRSGSCFDKVMICV